MGLIAASGRVPAPPSDADFGDRKNEPAEPKLESHDLIGGASAAARPLAMAQAYLAIGGGLIGMLAILPPHPSEWNVAGMLAVQTWSILCGIGLLITADRTPFWFVRIGPALGTVNTTLVVHFSGDATSGFALFYLWVALYVFYFPGTRGESVFYVAFTLANYALAVATTPIHGADQTDYSQVVVSVGTIITAGVLLTYLRARVERLVRRLTDASRTDPLTGLPNRVALHEVLAAEIERAKPQSRPLSVLVLDADKFKLFNDKHGVAAGDGVLRQLGRVLQEGVRLPDTVTRSGGGEYVLILPETDKHEAFLMAEDLLGQIRESIETPNGPITASIGVAAYPDHGDRVNDLLGAADEAMRAAKALGRDRAVLYSAEVTSTLGLAAGRRNIESQAQLATVLSLAEALDQRDTSTAKHSQTVGRLSEMMAIQLGCEDAHVERVRLAGVLHDIGKIGVPDSILQKPGALTDEEWAQMRRHPELGARILSSSELDDVRGWILAHHERPDGRGYPKGLSAEEIPLEASILAVADAYEAMIADRVYRAALGPEVARQELIDNSGTQFEPMVVQALLVALETEDQEPSAANGNGSNGSNGRDAEVSADSRVS
jgi:diguanylate cyclase (GGDEF)-like protein/putative nucleotidyltransferase with HDIG domain